MTGSIYGPPGTRPIHIFSHSCLEKRKSHEDIAYRSRNPLITHYFHKILKESVGIAKVKDFDRVLDFGSGECYLEAHLPLSSDYMAYDIRFLGAGSPYVGDYTKTNPDIIFAIHVLEHLTLEELGNTLKNFVRMRPKKIITAIPTGNALSRLGASLTGVTGMIKHEHKLNIRQIHTEIRRHFIPQSKAGVLTMTKIVLWRPIEK